jgi:O-antigen ligase
MERATKLAVVLSATGLLAFDLAIGRAWSGMVPAGVTLFLIAAILTVLDRRAVGLVLITAFVFPSIIRLTLQTYSAPFSALWMAALLGAIAPDAFSSRWHLPRRWRAPLVLAALAVAAGTPIVIVRELDFNPALLEPVYQAVLSGLPPFFAGWVAHVGLTLLVGVLWFDWLLGARDLDFERHVVLPLGGSAAVMAAVSVYQLVGDIAFLNETVYAALGRASGTMYDANVCGTLAAAGLAGALVWFNRGRGWQRMLAMGALLLFGLAVWGSGSRTAFGAALVVLIVSGWSWWRAYRETRVPIDPRLILAVGALVAAFVVAAVGTAQTATGPLRRLVDLREDSGSGTVRAMAAELWNRNGYGTAATHLIKQFPLTGIGIGGFHMFGPILSSVGRLPPDNAQNWLRHQLVEMGVLGALGWFLFAGSFAWFVLSPGRRAPAWAGPVRGLVIAIGGISLVGMPTQEISALVAFLTAAAWYVRLSAADLNDGPLGRGTWVAIVVVTVAFGASTLQAARTDLRVPVRARAIGWPYSYGFYSPEPNAGGGEVRWTAKRAAALVDVRGRTLRLSVWVPHADIADNPVDLKVWCEGRRVLDTRLTSNDPVTATFQVPAGLRQVLVDVAVSRTVRPADFGGADGRDLGVLVKWDATP